jgi:hypothetical protein
MTMSLHAPLTAIARQLQDDYLPIVRKPVPRELKDLLAQLVALEARGRESSRQHAEILLPAIVQRGPRP